MPESLVAPVGRPAFLALPGALALGVLALVAAGCSGPSGPPDSVSLVPPRPLPQGVPAGQRPPASAGLGLQPLPSPQQVTAAVALGRLDPFVDPRPPEQPLTTKGAPPAMAGAGAAPGSLAGGAPAAGARGRSAGAGRGSGSARLALELTGVIESGGLPSAIVQIGANSGTLVAGERGGDGQSLLPAGWKVESININQGRLDLRHGSRTYPYFLSQI